MRPRPPSASSGALPLEELNGTLVSLGFLEGPEGAKVTAPSRPGIYLAGVEAVLTGFQLADHLAPLPFDGPPVAKGCLGTQR